MRTLVPLLLLVTVLAGCVGTQAPDAPGGPAEAPPTEPAEAPVGTGSSTPAETAHVHDLWQGKRAVTLVESDVDVEAVRVGPDQVAEPETLVRGCESWTSLFPSATCLGRAEFDPDPPADGERRIVPPGTSKLRVVASWEDPTVTGVVVEFEPAYAPGWRTLGVSGASGETIVAEASRWNPSWESFPLGWTDDGHATQSRWRFAVAAYAGDGAAALAHGTIHVTVEAVRGDGPLPAEPPHPDWYGETSTYRLAERDRNITEEWEQVQAWWLNRWNYRFYMEPANPVPPGTEEIVFQVNLTNSSPAPGTPATETVADLYYWSDGFPDEYSDPPGTRVEDKTRDGDRVTFRIPVQPHETDSLYSCGDDDSLWGFVLWVHPPTVEDPVLDWSHGTAMHYDGRIQARGMATQETGADPAALSPADAGSVEGCREVTSRAT